MPLLKCTLIGWRLTIVSHTAYMHVMVYSLFMNLYVVGGGSDDYKSVRVNTTQFENVYKFVMIWNKVLKELKLKRKEK